MAKKSIYYGVNVMRFLCSDNRVDLATLSEGEIIELWFDYMQNAALYYEIGQWREAIAYSGCSLELSMIFLEKANERSRLNACRKLCLSAIYCSNSLIHHNECYKSNYILTIAGKILENHMGNGKNIDEIEASIRIVLNEASHNDYFEAHLNLPFKAVEPMGKMTAELM